ncbi:MAG: flagellar biosynthesis anti-sigma factor FlgM [Oligoflexia bacterium]|nr:flagellar biosynthesis anti-sigma factor FlgM [Oligoflexia bacterium]
MKIDALTRLLYSGSPSSPSGASQTAQSTEQASENARSEAVRISARSSDATAESGDARRKRVEELKREVASGTYRRDSRDVAVAVARELFV